MNKYFKIAAALALMAAVTLGLARRKTHIIDAPLADKSLTQYYERSQQLADSHVSSKVNFLAVGDIMLGRGVEAAAARAHDPSLPFAKLGDLLRSTDFNFGNLESPLANSRSTSLGPQDFILK